MKPVSIVRAPRLELDRVRMGVPADVVVGLEHGDLMLAVQPVRDDVAGDAAADDRDLHAAPRARHVARAQQRGAAARFRSQITPSAARQRRT